MPNLIEILQENLCNPNDLDSIELTLANFSDAEKLSKQSGEILDGKSLSAIKSALIVLLITVLKQEHPGTIVPFKKQ